MTERTQTYLVSGGIVAFILFLLGLLFSIPLPPQAPACKVCHCGKVSCNAACSEENMCAVRCEGLCKK
jgi:hypothetical protein